MICLNKISTSHASHVKASPHPVKGQSLWEQIDVICEYVNHCEAKWEKIHEEWGNRGEGLLPIARSERLLRFFTFIHEAHHGILTGILQPQYDTWILESAKEGEDLRHRIDDKNDDNGVGGDMKQCKKCDVLRRRTTM